MWSSFVYADDCGKPFDEATVETAAPTNVLLEPPPNPHGAIPFDLITSAQFEPAFAEGMRKSRERLTAIQDDANRPTFANTIEALEAVKEPVHQVELTFENYLSMETDETLDALAKRVLPEISAFDNSIYFNRKIFARVKRVYERRDSLGLSDEQMIVLENTYREFVRNGAKLGARQQRRVGAIDQRLSVLFEVFKNNVNAVVKEYALVITDSAQLAGLPTDARKTAAALAKSKKLGKSWVFTLQQPSIVPFLEFADNRALREQIWRAFSTRASDGAHDNRPVVLEIAKLRQERALLLSYASHAEFMTETRMAGSYAKVDKFLTELSDAYLPAARKDLADLEAIAGHPIEPWDVAYYSNKLRQQRFNYSEEELRPYFVLDNVIQGAFYAATRLYGVTFHARADIPTWDKEVRAYEVQDGDGKVISLFYLDPHPRSGVKRPGAWMNFARVGGLFDGQTQIPHVINVGNFTEAVGNKPALLNMREVTTVFHELGHGLHGMLSQARYRSIFGTSVAWDFVELPSQFFENWALEPEVLAVYAKHYRTGKPIPKSLVAKVIAAQTFQAGYIGLKQVMQGRLDLAWYSQDISHVTDVVAWEQQAVAPYRLIPAHDQVISTSFSHIFSGGYSAGYYSYKWAEVLAADAAAVFKQNGMFNPDFALRFRQNILEDGGRRRPQVQYRAFKGSDPDPQSLLRQEGLIH